MAFDSEHMEKYEKKLAKAILNRVSYMSDTKWKKFFQAIEKSGLAWLDIYDATIKFVIDEVVKPFHFQDYCGGYIEGTYGPARYKEIEWIFIPVSYGWNRASNDIHALKKLVDGLGLYEYDFDEDGLKIYGYK